MNREIKFRVWGCGQMWYEDTKTIDGNEVSLHFYNSKSKNIGWGLYDNHFENRLVTGDKNAIFNTPGHLMQYTGLKDKNGIEIYEGDIMAWNKYEGTKYQTRWVVDEGTNFKSKSWSSSDKEEDAIVIGNIYEHPHLLNSDSTDERSVASKAK